MLRTISARSIRSASPNHGAAGNQRRALVGSPFRNWVLPSAFPHLPRPVHREARRYTHTDKASFKPGPNGYVESKIRDKIVVEGKIFPPPERGAFESKSSGYRTVATSLVAKAGELITVAPGSNLYELSKKTVNDNLLQAVHQIAHAGTVMIVTGRNMADGKVTIDGPVSAALAAHALNKCRKVPVIICDAINKKLIQKLLGEINPDCARYMKYLPINEVNGKLFGALSRHVVTQGPDVTLYIDVPGRNGNGHYFDEHGKSIGMTNVAFDQALNIQNSLGKETIAICRSANNAGMAGVETPALVGDNDIRASLGSQLPLLVGDVIDGTFALMELVSNACTDMNAFTPDQLRKLLKTAIDTTEDKTFTATPMRRIGKQLEQRSDAGALTVESRESSVKKLRRLQELVDARPVIWPSSLDKLKLEGPATRYVVLYDSSDGVLIATDDFLGYASARSQFHLKFMLVADHNKASYGDWCQKELFHIVVDGMVFSALQGPDVITLVCNTACTVDLIKRVREIIVKALANAGKATKVEIIDLIATVAQAIIDEGGSRPALLSTEGTAKSRKYNETVKQIAHRDKIEEPEMLVIGCGHKEARPGHDLAGLINKGAHQDPNSADYMVLLRELYRYCEQIPLNATSIWLCCTHFPAVREMIRKIMNERLVAHGLPPDSIPIIDPIEFQAEATIAFLRANPPALKDYSKIPDITVVTTGLPGTVMKSVQRYIKSHKNVPVIDVIFPKIDTSGMSHAQKSPRPDE